MSPKLIVSLAALALAGTAFAKLPAPSDEAKAKAAEAKAKADWAGKVAGYKLCMSQDKVAQVYRTKAQAAGKDVKAATATPACADPGPFAAAPAAPK